ncbi:MAG: transcriptional repressor [Dehalococcoidales bacterium]|nr:transcriptional repressor [Dehalococcoidales bacterium]
MRRETKQREAILRVLRNTRAHPTADWIYEEVKKEIPNISKGTVYRNLQVLQEGGIVTELNLNGTLSRFEAKQDSHYHFRCEQCGRVFDLDEPVNNELDERVARRTGFKVSHHQLEFRGLCKDCQQLSQNRKRRDDE